MQISTFFAQGISFSREIVRLSREKACQLPSTSTDSIADVAKLLGFSSPSVFSRAWLWLTAVLSPAKVIPVDTLSGQRQLPTQIKTSAGSQGYGGSRPHANIKNKKRDWRLAESADRGQYRINNKRSSRPSSVATETRSSYTRNTNGMNRWALSPFPDAHIQDTLSLTEK